MRYFLIIGLMMMSSFAQADICIPLWWKSATVFQIELEAELKGPFAMNVPCEDGRLPIELVLENTRDFFSAYAAILEHFELKLDGRARYQLRTIAGMQLQQAYEELASRAEPVFGPGAESRKRNSNSRVTILDLASLSDEYSEISIRGGGGDSTIRIRDNYPPYQEIHSYIDYNIEINKKEIDNNISRFETPSRRDYYTSDASSFRAVRDIRRTRTAREAYDKALEEYRTRLAIYKIVVPSE